LKCPNCSVNFGLMSKELSSIQKTKTCPSCGGTVTFGLLHQRFAIVFFPVAIVALLLSASTPLATAIAGGTAAALSLGLRGAPSPSEKVQKRGAWLLRALTAVVSLGSLLVWVPLFMLFGGKLLDSTGGPRLATVPFVASAVLVACAGGLCVLFASGLLSAFGTRNSRRLWLTCIALGIVTCALAWYFGLRRTPH
jgi:hypothetical protein